MSAATTRATRREVRKYRVAHALGTISTILADLNRMFKLFDTVLTLCHSVFGIFAVQISVFFVAIFGDFDGSDAYFDEVLTRSHA